MPNTETTDIYEQIATAVRVELAKFTGDLKKKP